VPDRLCTSERSAAAIVTVEKLDRLLLPSFPNFSTPFLWFALIQTVFRPALLKAANMIGDKVAIINAAAGIIGAVRADLAAALDPGRIGVNRRHRPDFPRDKTCGSAISPKGRNLLEEIGAKRLRPLRTS
jgi:hypothetical protein